MNLQNIEDIFIEAECEYDPKGHFFKVNDPHKVYKAIQNYVNQTVSKELEDFPKTSDYNIAEHLVKRLEFYRGKEKEGE